MEKEWINYKSVIVVGASNGIGKYLAFNLIIKHNCKVIGISNNKSEMENFFERIYEYRNNFTYYIFDACKEKEWENFAENLKINNINIDIIINCVGDLPKFIPFENHTQKEVINIVNANFYSSIFSIRHLLSLLKKSDEPGIINISCMTSTLSLGGTSIYSASKSALISYTQILSQELDDNFYVGIVLLGMVKTDFFKKQDKKITEKILSKAMLPSKATKKILYGICAKKSRIIVGLDARMYDGLNRLFPSFAHKIIKKYANKKNIKLYD